MKIVHFTCNKKDVKKIIFNGTLTSLVIIANLYGYCQQVGINATGSIPNVSALLDVDAASSNPKKGLLIPRVSLTSATDAATIPTPATSLLVYNTGTAALVPAGYYYNSGTTGAAAWVRFNTTDPCSQSIPTNQWPTFDGSSPYVLLGALWVGYDASANCWKYNKQASGRGLTDPGNPNTWTVNGTTINYFNGRLGKLPSGTHVNNRYDPQTMAARYSQDDIMVKTGNLWTDKYESRIIDVSGPTFKDNNDQTAANPADNDIRGNGQGIPPTWMAFSQKALGTKGMSWFVAQAAAGNGGKRLITNAEWQLAAKGTARTDATGMTAGGETWASVADQDVSQFGVVGTVGSIFEWTADWGPYGGDSGLGNNAQKDQGASYGNDYTFGVAGAGWTDNTSLGTNVFVPGLTAAVARGGYWGQGTQAGVFCYHANSSPTAFHNYIGFRCVR